MGRYKHKNVGGLVDKSEWLSEDLHTPVVLDATPTAPTEGDKFYHSGNNTEYLYDGSSWIDLTSQGVTNLSGLTIDANKDWQGKNITNLGAISPKHIFVRRLNENLPITTLGDGEEIKLHNPFTAPAGASLKIIETQVANSAGTPYTNLTLEVYNVDDATVAYSTNSDYNYGSPISSVDIGGKTIVVRVANATGSPYDIGAEFDGCIVV